MIDHMSANEQQRLANGPQAELKVSISYRELKAEFDGTPDTVLHSIMVFLQKEIPAFDLAKKLALNYSGAELVDSFQKYIRITPEGARIMTEEKLSDKEIVATQLVAQKIAYESGSSHSPSATLIELQECLSLNPKSLSSRLSELSKSGHVSRETTDEGTTFKITTLGISWLKETLGKKTLSRS